MIQLNISSDIQAVQYTYPATAEFMQFGKLDDTNSIQIKARHPTSIGKIIINYPDLKLSLLHGDWLARTEGTFFVLSNQEKLSG